MLINGPVIRKCWPISPGPIPPRRACAPAWRNISRNSVAIGMRCCCLKASKRRGHCCRDFTYTVAVIIACRRRPWRTADSLTHALDNYAVSGLIELGREGLDDGCRFDQARYLELTETADKLGVPAGTSRYKLLIFQAHYQWRLRRFEDAMATLLEAYNILPEDPVPLFLMTEWLIS